MNRRVQKHQTGRRGGRHRNGTIRSTELSEDLEGSESTKHKKDKEQKLSEISSAKDVVLSEVHPYVRYVEAEAMTKILNKNEKENNRKRNNDMPTQSDMGFWINSNEDLLKNNNDDSQNDKISEISKQIEKEKAKTSESFNIKVVMDQIQLMLESMSKEELLKLCKMKIEEEITVRTDKLEKEKKVGNLERTLGACLKEMSFLQQKNRELKLAISAIYEEYKKEKGHSIIEVDLKNPPETEYTPQVSNFPIITPLNLTDGSHNFILPDNPPEESYEFITCDHVKAEVPDSQEAEYITGDTQQTDSVPATIKQENLAVVNLQHSPNSGQQGKAPMQYILISHESDNHQALRNFVNLGEILPEKPEDSLDIEDKIPHALITCNKSPLRNDNENPLTKNKTLPGNAHGVEVFNVLQSIDLTNELRKSQMNNASINPETGIENLLSNCTPRIVSTQSLAPKSASNNHLFSESPQSKSHNSMKASVTIPEPQNTTQNVSATPAVSNLLNNIQPVMTGTNPMQFAFVVNGTGGQVPKKVYFSVSSQNKVMMTPQIAGVTSLSTASNQKLAPKPVNNNNLSATQIGTSAVSAPYITMSKVMVIDTNAKTPSKPIVKNVPNKIPNIIRKRSADDVFDLTDDEPSNKIVASAGNKVYENGQIISTINVNNAGVNKNKNLAQSPLKRIILSKTAFQNTQKLCNTIKPTGGIKVANLSPSENHQNSNPTKVWITKSMDKLSTQRMVKSIVKLTPNGKSSIIGYKAIKDVESLELQK